MLVRKNPSFESIVNWQLRIGFWRSTQRWQESTCKLEFISMFTRNVVLVDKKMEVPIPPKAEGSGMTSLTVVKMGTVSQAKEAILGMAMK